ncbi:MAG: DUF2252 domain-containing protein [Candidatus Nanopelagicales bacterium]
MAGSRAHTHLSVPERVARGKAARAKVPRSSQAGFTALADRRDPIDILQEQAATRVPDLVPIRYGRMAASPFAFYRGAAAVMAADLAATPDSGLPVQACGDAHLVNFGVYAAPDRRLVFDVNDFDETNPGPWEWDLKRLAASMAVAGRSNAFTVSQRASVLSALVSSYQEAMVEFAGMGDLEVWYARMEIEAYMRRFASEVSKKQINRVRKARDKAVARDNLQALEKLTEVVDGKPRFISQPPLIVPINELFSSDQADAVTSAITQAFSTYRRTLSDDCRHLFDAHELADIAHKVVGVGSVGTRAWIALMFGRDENDPLILQIKQAQESVLEPHTGRSAFRNAGQRVVAGQRLMQAASDIFLGWTRVKGPDGIDREFYVRQLRDGKGSADVDVMNPVAMSIYAKMCGWTLARAHARSGDRIAISSYVGTGAVFAKAIASFAEDYADQNELDHAELLKAIKAGRVKAQLGV